MIDQSKNEKAGNKMARSVGRQIRKEEKRQKILKEATVLFAQNGYSETTIAMVAKAADISFGSVFSYFPSKEELFAACVLEPLQELRPMFLGVKDDTGPVVKVLAKMVERHVSYFCHQEPFLRLVQYVLGMPERFPNLFRELDGFVHEVVASLRPLLARGQANKELAVIDAELVTFSYMSFLIGIRLTVRDDVTHHIWRLLSKQALRLFGPLDEEIYTMIGKEG